MPFSSHQKKKLIEQLTVRGWRFENDTIYSPSRELWLSQSHFLDWSPEDMSEIFLNRAKRIQSAKIGEHWLKSRKENREIHESIVAAGLPHATQIEREKYELIGRGTGIHWPLIDEDLSVSGILKGNPSYESEKSLKAWLDERGSIQSR